MPWKEICCMEERLRFISYYEAEEISLAALCRAFGISRKTGYKYIRRHEEEGWEGLQDRSRAPRHCPHAVSEAIESMILLARQAHPTWGPKKLRAWLANQDSSFDWPAASTIGDIIKRHGLEVKRRHCRKSPIYSSPFQDCNQANEVWSGDFKGWFETGNGVRCEPLTISDNFSRYLIRCQAVKSIASVTIKPLFEAAFREYGLPRAIRTDNGPPFATTTVGGLSRLSMWWIKLGIIPERIRPGCPQQNGRHERMHRTLKAETATPPRNTWIGQQKAFDRFRQEYNYQRPHEALGQKTPASLYRPSPREYPLILPELIYPDDMVIRRVKSQGDISWKNHHIYLCQTLAGESVGFRQISEKLWDIYFGPIRLAQMDTFEKRLKHLPRNRKRLNNVNQT